MLGEVAFISGAVMIMGSLTTFVFGFFNPEKKLFPLSRPRWIIAVCWFYLTAMICAWLEVLKARSSAGILVAGMISLQAVKFLFIFIYYSDMRDFLLLLIKNRLAFTGVILSACIVGTLIGYAGRFVP